MTDEEREERDYLRRCAQFVAEQFLQDAMNRPTKFQISILRCVILNAVTLGITDDDFIERIFSTSAYRADAERVRAAVGNDIGKIIARTCDLIEGKK